MERKSCVKENKKVVNKKRRHPELDSGSHLIAVSKSGEIPNQVWNDKFIFNNDNNNAFTLIELLVVVLIIGILAAVALPQYQKAVLKSRYTQLMAFGNAIEKAAEAYHLANGVYPASFDELAVDFPGEKREDYSGKMTVMSYEGKTCQLAAGMHDRPDSIKCSFSTADGRLSYLSVYSGRACMASYEWTLGNKICQNMTGKTTHTGRWGSSGINLHNVYPFN